MYKIIITLVFLVVNVPFIIASDFGENHPPPPSPPPPPGLPINDALLWLFFIALLIGFILNYKKENKADVK